MNYTKHITENLGPEGVIFSLKKWNIGELVGNAEGPIVIGLDHQRKKVEAPNILYNIILDSVTVKRVIEPVYEADLDGKKSHDTEPVRDIVTTKGCSSVSFTYEGRVSYEGMQKVNHFSVTEEYPNLENGASQKLFRISLYDEVLGQVERSHKPSAIYVYNPSSNSWYEERAQENGRIEQVMVTQSSNLFDQLNLILVGLVHQINSSEICTVRDKLYHEANRRFDEVGRGELERAGISPDFVDGILGISNYIPDGYFQGPLPEEKPRFLRELNKREPEGFTEAERQRQGFVDRRFGPE